MSKKSLDELVLPENMDAWIPKRNYWFVDDQEDKTPGYLYLISDFF